MKKINLRETKGITLIALVVTIIVLLILAAVSISMLTGQNGILNRASSAKKITREAELEEEIKLAVQSAQIEGLGVLVKENLETELRKISEENVEYEESTQKFTVSRDGYAFTVDLDSNVVSANGIVLDKSTLNLLTGKNETLTVSYVGNASGTVTWTSSNTAVATVDSTGKVTAEDSTGSATITATCGSYTAKCTVTVKEPTFADYSWDEISKLAKAIAQDGDISNYTVQTSITKTIDGKSYTVKIGDTKPITIGSGTNAETHNAVVIGFKHDDVTDVSYGATKAGISFQLEDCLNTTAQMNSTATNSGSWASSAMRKYLNENGTKADGTSDSSQVCIYNQIESDAKNVIKQVKKVTGDYANQTDSGLITTNDYLWLLSEKEVFGARTYSIDVECSSNTQYSYYTAGNSKIKKTNGSFSPWWLRSPHYNYYADFCVATSLGNVTYTLASRTHGVAFGFAI